ncbi:MerR family transcriptional regulator [Streptomyces sp. ME02-6987-2C]|uniref:MerR family transcriptional regulator n=1 Tax=unclassified Streptomyces TaxID=2593676 RepID=UPI0029B99F75|nr:MULTISPECIES: MerR family transcriptional regulator [unclassified Streptomyces]MDX3368784.1 MerR family transcriptional regulator [Streptomyces sp. ME02-6987-2C]MDX3426222.1 MerR family transcriptional regulator [Streptomyces sp. ME02-6985-2c]
MNGATPPHSIGELSARTGVSVRTIRFYSDTGLLPPTDRTPAGYRRYGEAALDRLHLIGVLRELDVGLTTVRRVLDGDLTVAEAAAAHADATALQIRALRLRHSVLRLVARRDASPEETVLMHRIARLTSDERRRLIADFIAALEAGTPHARDAAALRTALPELPDEPSDAQLAAWVELAELVADDGFRERMARAALPPADEDVLPGVAPEAVAELVPFVRQTVAGARAAGIDPEGDEAAPVVDAVTARFAAVLGRPDGPELREWLAGRFEAGHDPLVERYWRLVWTLNDWQVVPGHLPFQPWMAQALRRPGRVSPSRR